jgi:lysophospholipase L1-like esterase
MITRTLLAAALLTVAGAAFAADAPTGPVPAELFKARDGLGNTFAKLDAGGEVHICYFGGSITAQPGWRVKTTKWFQATWPKAKVIETDATIGGTDSEHGVYRCGQDVLASKPDLVFVEFAVNDGGGNAHRIYQAMEGIVRQIWRANPDTDICYVYTFRTGYEKQLDAGNNPPAASAHERVADHYGIPSINVAMKTCELQRAGKLVYVSAKGPDGKPLPDPPGVIVFSDDGVHPRIEGGHVVYTDVITSAITQMRATSKPMHHELIAPLVADNWEAAKLVPLKASMLSAEWTKLDPTKGRARDFHNRLPELWFTETPGATLTFRFKGTTAKLYDLLGPDGGMVTVEVDGKVGRPVPRFDSYCEYWRLANLPLCSGVADAEHTVKVTLLAQQPDRGSVVNRIKDKPGFDPKKYDGTRLWVGSIMVLGDVVD